MNRFVLGHALSRQQFQILTAINQTFCHQMDHAFRAFLHFAFGQQ